MPLVGQSAHSSNGKLHRYYHYVRRPKNLEKIRPHLIADELEEKVFSEFKKALGDGNYFVDLEQALKIQSEFKNKNSESEYHRAQKELAAVNSQFDGLMMNQGKMQLTDLALKLTSEELNRLAKKKEDMEKHIKSLDYQHQGIETFREQVLFVENQIRNLMQGGFLLRLRIVIC